MRVEDVFSRASLGSQYCCGRCPNVPNGHTHAAKFAMDAVVKNRDETKKNRQMSLQEDCQRQFISEGISFITVNAIPILKG